MESIISFLQFFKNAKIQKCKNQKKKKKKKKKNAMLIFQKIDFLNYTFHTRIWINFRFSKK